MARTATSRYIAMIGTKAEVMKWLIDEPDKTFEVKEWHPKRSLTANGYYWALIGKLAQALRTSTDELHEQMLMQYGVCEGTVVTMKAAISVKHLPGHWRLIKSDGTWNAWLRYAGSHEMDTAQFSALLDGLIGECKEQRIETMPEGEIERLRGYVCTSERKPA